MLTSTKACLELSSDILSTFTSKIKLVPGLSFLLLPVKKKSTLVFYKNVFCIILLICTSLLCQYKAKKKFENRSILKTSRVPSI